MFSLPFIVDREITVEKPLSEVFNFVADFKNWPKWSPWLCQEPDCPIDIEATPATIGHKQTWNGKNIGSGHMTISEIQPSQSIKYDLYFLKPWKSHSKVAFEFSEDQEGCRVRWTMNGSVPVFLFFMKKMMQSFVGMDYERGLSMLKEFLETGDVPTKVVVKGLVEQEGFSYIGKRRQCSIREVGPAMQKRF